MWSWILWVENQLDVAAPGIFELNQATQMNHQLSLFQNEGKLDPNRSKLNMKYPGILPTFDSLMAAGAASNALAQYTPRSRKAELFLLSQPPRSKQLGTNHGLQLWFVFCIVWRVGHVLFLASPSSQVTKVGGTVIGIITGTSIQGAPCGHPARFRWLSWAQIKALKVGHHFLFLFKVMFYCPVYKPSFGDDFLFVAGVLSKSKTCVEGF